MRSPTACLHGAYDAKTGRCPDCGALVETTLPPMPVSDETKKALITAGVKAQEWTRKRDELIRRAVHEGGSLREIGAMASISHTAVKFIAHGRPER